MSKGPDALKALVAAQTTLPTVEVIARPGAQVPARATEGSSGYDLCSNVKMRVRGNGGFGAIPTGIQLAIPKGWEAQVRSRSGLAMKNQVFVLNSPGTIDSDYRGEIIVLLCNFGRWHLDIRQGERIAQLVFAKVAAPEMEVVPQLDATERGEGGFGSTG